MEDTLKQGRLLTLPSQLSLLINVDLYSAANKHFLMTPIPYVFNPTVHGTLPNH